MTSPEDTLDARSELLAVLNRVYSDTWYIYMLHPNSRRDRLHCRLNPCPSSVRALICEVNNVLVSCAVRAQLYRPWSVKRGAQ